MCDLIKHSVRRIRIEHGQVVPQESAREIVEGHEIGNSEVLQLRATQSLTTSICQELDAFAAFHIESMYIVSGHFYFFWSWICVGEVSVESKRL